MDPMTIFMIFVLGLLIFFMIVQKNKKKTTTTDQPHQSSNGTTTEISLINGYNGQVSFDGTNVTISRKGALAKMSFGFSGEKRIPVTSIISVQYKEASSMLNGFIQFATAARESAGGLTDASQDENSVLFTKSQNADFAELRKAVEEAIAKRHTAATTVIQNNSSVAEELEKMASLLEKGILTQEEFDKQKSKLLNS